MLLWVLRLIENFYGKKKEWTKWAYRTVWRGKQFAVVEHYIPSLTRAMSSQRISDIRDLQSSANAEAVGWGSGGK